MGSRKKDIALTPRADRAVLLELAERCEREEASRQLDVFIACEVLGLERKPMGGYRGDPPPWAWETRPFGRDWWNCENIHHILGYTESVDDALTIVPEHFSYELTFSAAGEGAMRRARLWDWRRGPLMIDPANEWQATAKTLPLAISAAALKAKAAIAEQEQASMQRGEARTPPPKPKKEGT